MLVQIPAAQLVVPERAFRVVCGMFLHLLGICRIYGIPNRPSPDDYRCGYVDGTRVLRGSVLSRCGGLFNRCQNLKSAWQN